jgi:hypothetical protein
MIQSQLEHPPLLLLRLQEQPVAVKSLMRKTSKVFYGLLYDFRHVNVAKTEVTFFQTKMHNWAYYHASQRQYREKNLQ